MESRKTLRDVWDEFLERIDGYEFMYMQPGDNILPHCKDFLLVWDNGYTGKYTFRKFCERCYDFKYNACILKAVYIPRNETLFDCFE